MSVHLNTTKQPPEFPFNPFICPKCGSWYTTFGVGSDGKNAFFKCEACGYTWPEKEADI